MAYQHQRLEDLYSKLSIADEEQNGLVIGVEEVKQTVKEFSLVGKFLTEKNINFNAMQNVLASLWRPKEGMEVHDLGEQRYAFIFYHVMDIKKVLEGGPWSFEQNLLVAQQYSEGVNPLTITLEDSEIWVQVYDLPKGFVSENILRSVGNYIGMFVKADPANFESNWKPFYRIRVIIKVNKPLKRRMQIKREGGSWSWINFKYERLSTFCFVCGILGHSDKDCDVMYANPDKVVEKAYGPWLRAPMKNAKVNTGARWLRNPVMANSSSMGFGDGPNFRSGVAKNVESQTDFEEIDGIIREKKGMQSGITMVSRDQGDRVVANQSVQSKAGDVETIWKKDMVVVDPKRKRVDDIMDQNIGLANPRAVRFLKELVQQLRPSLIFLSEIFVDKNKTAAVGKQLGFPNCWVVDTDRHGGGVALLWKGENAIQIKDSSENFIDVEVTVDQVGCWRYTGFYGYPERSRRRDSWNLLLDLSRRSNTPWCVLGGLQ